jgi:hypothetical protein
MAPSNGAARGARLLDMQRHPLEFRCDVCRRLVDEETRARAQRAWQPLIVCEKCVGEAETAWTMPQREQLAPAA